MNPTEVLIWGIVIHLVVDWLLQNHWMAQNKTSVLHLAAWVHSGLHTVALLLIFTPLLAFCIGALHLVIDTRLPLQWWRRTYRQTVDGPVALAVAIWGDQVAHIGIIAFFAAISQYA